MCIASGALASPPFPTQLAHSLTDAYLLGALPNQPDTDWHNGNEGDDDKAEKETFAKRSLLTKRLVVGW